MMVGLVVSGDERLLKHAPVACLSPADMAAFLESEQECAAPPR